MAYTKEKFIEKAIQVHGDKYDYSKVDYKGCLEHVIIICPEHGEFIQKPMIHLRNHGCPECGKIKGNDIVVDPQNVRK